MGYDTYFNNDNLPPGYDEEEEEKSRPHKKNTEESRESQKMYEIRKAFPINWGEEEKGE